MRRSVPVLDPGCPSHDVARNPPMPASLPDTFRLTCAKAARIDAQRLGEGLRELLRVGASELPGNHGIFRTAGSNRAPSIVVLG